MPNESDAKIKTLALIIKFGHDLFGCKDVKSVAVSAVNNSHILLNFRSSALFKLHKNKSCEVLGQYAQTEADEYSSAVLLQKDLLKNIDFEKSSTFILENDKLPGELAENNSVYLIEKLPFPAAGELEHSYIWLLEYDRLVPETAVTTAQLLGRSIAEALCLAEVSGRGKYWKPSRFFSKIVRTAIVFLLLTAIMCIPIRESATAEFMLKAPEITAVYAWFDTPIARCLKQDGEFVKKGETVILLDTAELNYRLANAQSALKEAETDLELARQAAFTDESKLGKVKLLKARCDLLAVTVQEAMWYLKNSEIKANADGILVLSDGRAEQLIGKAVKAGDKLFEIYSGQGMIAEIMVNERDASILNGKFDAELFLHTAPDQGFSGEIVSVAQYPVLNEQNFYCYPVRAKISETTAQGVRFGMRGVVKLSGKKVSSGYYLFKNLILYFRNW